jgi:hydrogenase maturation protease
VTASHAVSERVVIGIGNVFRRDDGVGDAAAVRVGRALASPPARPGIRVRVASLDGEPTRVLDVWNRVELAVVVDAMSSGAEPGTIERMEIDCTSAGGVHTGWSATGSARSTHGAGLPEAVALGRALGRLPERLVVYAVEGADFREGPGLSTAVDAAVDLLVALIVEELAP